MKREFGHKPKKLMYKPRPIAPIITVMGRDYHAQLQDGELRITRLADEMERVTTWSADSLFTEIELAIDLACTRIFRDLPADEAETEEAA